MPINVTCTHCGACYRLSSSFNGKKVRCKSCNESFRAEEPAEPAGEVEAVPIDEDDGDQYGLTMDEPDAFDGGATPPAGGEMTGALAALDDVAGQDVAALPGAPEGVGHGAAGGAADGSAATSHARGPGGNDAGGGSSRRGPNMGLVYAGAGGAALATFVIGLLVGMGIGGSDSTRASTGDVAGGSGGSQTGDFSSGAESSGSEGSFESADVAMADDNPRRPGAANDAGADSSGYTPPWVTDGSDQDSAAGANADETGTPTGGAMTSEQSATSNTQTPGYSTELSPSPTGDSEAERRLRTYNENGSGSDGAATPAAGMTPQAPQNPAPAPAPTPVAAPPVDDPRAARPSIPRPEDLPPTASRAMRERSDQLWLGYDARIESLRAQDEANGVTSAAASPAPAATAQVRPTPPRPSTPSTPRAAATSVVSRAQDPRMPSVPRPEDLPANASRIQRRESQEQWQGYRTQLQRERQFAQAEQAQMAQSPTAASPQNPRAMASAPTPAGGNPRMAAGAPQDGGRPPGMNDGRPMSQQGENAEPVVVVSGLRDVDAGYRQSQNFAIVGLASVDQHERRKATIDLITDGLEDPRATLLVVEEIATWLKRRPDYKPSGRIDELESYTTVFKGISSSAIIPLTQALQHESVYRRRAAAIGLAHAATEDDGAAMVSAVKQAIARGDSFTNYYLNFAARRARLSL